MTLIELAKLSKRYGTITALDKAGKTLGAGCVR